MNTRRYYNPRQLPDLARITEENMKQLQKILKIYKMRDSLLTRCIDSVNVILGLALTVNGAMEYAVLYNNFDQLSGLVERWLFPIFIMFFGILMTLVSFKKDLVLVYFTWFASHFGRAIWYFYIASLLVSMTKGQGYKDYAPWTHV